MESEWQLEPLLASRVQKARQLLAEDEEYQGDSGLKRYLEGMDASVALHRAVLDGTNRRRKGLSADQQLLALVALLRYVLTTMTQPMVAWLVEPACSQAVRDAIATLAKSQPESSSPMGSLLTLASAAARLLKGQGNSEQQLEDLAERVVPLFADKTALFGLWVDRNAPLRRLAAWLEEQQRRCGLPLALPRLELQLTGCILLRMAMEQLWELQKASGGRQQGGELSDRAIVGIAMKVVKTWLKHGPREGQPSALMCQAELLLMKRQLEEAFETIGMAMERAAEMKDRAVEAGAAMLAAAMLMSCQLEEDWSLEEVSDLLHDAEVALASCRRWLPNASSSVLEKDLTNLRRAVKATAAQHPGRDLLPPPEKLELPARSVLDRACSACGRRSVHLEACAACRSKHYCSRECQVRHWKHGGHKHKCADLAAARRSGRAEWRQ